MERVLLWIKQNTEYVLLILVLVVLVCIRYVWLLPTKNNVSSLNNSKHKVIARIIKEPDYRIEYSNYVVGISGMDGKVLVRTNIHPQYIYGDTVELYCFFREPENFNEKFNYIKYLKMQQIYSLCYYPSIKYVESGGNVIFKKILFFIDRKLEPSKVTFSISFFLI